MAFKRTLEQASLDNGDLDEEALNILRNPIQQTPSIDNRDTLLSLNMFLSASNGSDQIYKNIHENLVKDDPTREFLSHAQVKRKLAELTGVHAIVHEMCPGSCIAYTGPYSGLESCPECGISRYNPNKPNKPARQHFYTIPLGPQLQALWRTPNSAKNMRYRSEKTKEIIEDLASNGTGEIPVYEDMYHGHEYIQAVERGDIKTDDMVLMFAMDGAQLYRDKQSQCWIYIWVIVDLPPELRYKKRYVLPGGFIPGPNNPKNTDSFLFPGFHHLAALQKEGLKVWDASRNCLFISRPFLYCGCADGPGSVHFTGLVGHQGAYPCRLYCGIRGRHKPGVPQYYPALLKPHGYDVHGCDHGDIDPQSIGMGSVQIYQDNLKHLPNSRHVTEFKKRQRDTGISTISIFSGLESC